MIRLFERDEDFREEDLIRAAAWVYHAMAETFPSPGEYTHDFSPEFERKMEAVIALERRNRQVPALRWAVIILLCLALGLGVMTALNPDARAGLFSWVRSYEEVVAAEDSVGVGILRCGERLARLTSGHTITDIYTGEKICDIPQSWLDRFPNGHALAFDPAGDLWLAQYEDGTGMLLLRHDPTGSTPDREMVLTDWRGSVLTGADGVQDASVCKLIVTEEYIYLMCMENSFDKRLQVYTREGALQMELLTADFAVAPDGCFYTTSSASLDILYKFDPDTKEMLWSSDSGRDENDWRIFQLAADPGGEDLYLLMNAHIYRYSAETGARQEVYMNRAGNMLLCETEFVRDMLVDDSGRLYLQAGQTIYRYDPIEDEARTRPCTLTVAGPYKDALIAQAIGLYEKANPGARIEYRYAYDSLRAYDADASDVRARKMADMLAEIEDGGIDLILAADDVPWLHRVAGGDRVLDLTRWLEGQADGMEPDAVLLDAVTDADGISMLPLAVHEYYIEGNRTLMEALEITVDAQTTWSHAFALYEKVEGTEYALFSAAAKGDVLRWMLRSNADPATGAVNLRDPAVQTALEQLKAIWSKPNFFRSTIGTNDTDLTPDVLFCLTGYNENRAIGDQYWDYAGYHEETGGDMALLPMFAGQAHTSRGFGSNHIAMVLSEGRTEAALDFLQHLTGAQVMGSSLLWQRPLNCAVAREGLNTAVRNYAGAPAETEKAFRSEYGAVCRAVNCIYREEVLPNTTTAALIRYLEGEISLAEALES